MSPRNRRRLERGGVTTIVAILLGGGVFFGMLALSLDVGRVLAEKRELQNSADAAAQSLATDCWKAPASCTYIGAGAVATRTKNLANNNANDATTTIASACSVNIPGSPINGCPSTVSGFAECAALPPVYGAMSGLPYVEVRTRTRTTSGGNALTNFVAGFLGTQTTSVGACARSALGNAEGDGDVPITFSACDWQHATGGTTGGGGGAYYPSPVYSAAAPYGYGGAGGSPLWPAAAANPPAQNQGQEIILLAQNPPGGATAPSPCPNWQGHALPGGFGILETTSNPCEFVEYPHHWMHTSTGNNTSCNLDALVGKVINLPIFDCTADSAPGVAPPVGDCSQGNGNNAYYHRVGYAQFYLSGYSLNVTGGIPNKHKSLVSNQFPCNGGDRCISGWFLAGSLSATAITGPPGGAGSFGLVAAIPAG